MYINDFDDDNSDLQFNGNYRGVVVDNQDPLQAGRCKIRIFSVFDDIPDALLPWAEYADPMMQGNPGSGGFLIPDIGMKVWCFFESGEHMQPVYFAGAPSLRDGPPNKSANLDDVPRYGVKYTQNRAIRSPTGHLIEMDDTAGDSRVRISHRNGSQIVLYENGDMQELVYGNCRREIYGNLEEYVMGDVLRMTMGNDISFVNGNRTEIVNGVSYSAILGNSTYLYGANLTTTVNGLENHSVIGDFTLTINGNNKIQSTGSGVFWSAASAEIDAPTLSLNPTAAPAVEAAVAAPADSFEQPTTFQLTPQNAAVLIDLAGPKAAFDEDGETIPSGWPAEEVNDPVSTPVEIDVTANPNAPVTPDCELITTVDYSYRLSENFTLRDLSINAVFPHSIRAQVGLSVSDIVCNLKNLAVNILEPLKAKYPNIRINSGFRVGNGSSQHNKGQAVDIQIPGASAATYTEMATWIAKNLPFDQFILEHGKAVWLHLSYNPSLTNQRGQKLTYWPSGSPQYKPGLKNYYDGGRVIS